MKTSTTASMRKREKVKSNASRLNSHMELLHKAKSQKSFRMLSKSELSYSKAVSGFVKRKAVNSKNFHSLVSLNGKPASQTNSQFWKNFSTMSHYHGSVRLGKSKHSRHRSQPLLDDIFRKQRKAEFRKKMNKRERKEVSMIDDWLDKRKYGEFLAVFLIF